MARTEPPPPITVSELARSIVRVLEQGIGQVSVIGEVSNLRQPGSGHAYFVLKDADAAINCVCFRSTLARQLVRPANGQRLELRGRVSAYPPRSEYQIIVESMREAGLGELMRRLEELKQRLRAEGLFETARKRPIPRLPRCVGLVTSATGAALRDMLNVLRRRASGVCLVLAPAAVQGAQAPAEIVRALRRLGRQSQGAAGVEVIIVGRGGGSLEDLWAFNDERVVRAIAACPVPVISAVGHETDTTLADYAADLRAPTPSAAAELVSAHYEDVRRQVGQMGLRLARAVALALGERRARLVRCAASWGLRHPRERLARGMQRADELRQRLETLMPRLVARRRECLGQFDGRLARVNPRSRLAQAHSRLDRARTMLMTLGPPRWTARLTHATQLHGQLQGRLRRAFDARHERLAWRLAAARERLAAANPEAILRRGYSIVTRAGAHGSRAPGARERIVTDPAVLRPSEVVRIRSAGGRWRAAVLPGEEDLFDQL